MPDSFDFMFNFITVMVVVGFIVIIGIFVVIAVGGIAQWNKNNKSPVLTVDAQVVAKRADLSTHIHHNTDNLAMSHTTSSTTYYTTFEVESGDRIELVVPDKEFGMLAEGDKGRLTFQGTRYKGFVRT